MAGGALMFRERIDVEESEKTMIPLSVAPMMDWID